MTKKNMLAIKENMATFFGRLEDTIISYPNFNAMNKKT
jgi:hypothetical protein